METNPSVCACLPEVLADDRLRIEAQVLSGDTAAHQRLRRLAARLPSAAEVYDDAQLLATISEAVALADPSLYQTFLSHYVLCVGSVAELGGPSVDPESALSHAHAKGSFMVTEVGDASSHLGIRTRATYDPATREFVLHTPDARAAKFSSVAATGLPQKAVVLARLITNDQDHGVFSFLVDITGGSGAPSPGIQLSGPIGVDAVPLPYGLVKFNHVRLPFARWLSGGAEMTEDGLLHDPLGHPDARLQRTLSCGHGLWATLPSAMAGMSCRSAVLAWRYNSRRRSHGRLAPGSPVLAYRPQQHAVTGGLACAYTLRATARAAIAAWDSAKVRSSGLAPGSPPAMAFSPWPAVDPRLALYKAYSTQVTASLIDRLQHRCGVSGFFAVNRLAGYLGFARAFDNAGGDNTLIYLDAGRSLTEGADDSTLLSSAAAVTNDPADPSWWPVTAAVLERRLTGELRLELERRAAAGMEGLDLWNPLLDQALALGAVRARRVAADAVTEGLERGQLIVTRPVANTLAALDGVLQARSLAGELLAAEVLDPATVRRLSLVADEMCDRLKPNLPAIAEALDPGAGLAPAPMEDSDYAAALEAALNAPANHADGGAQ